MRWLWAILSLGTSLFGFAITMYLFAFSSMVDAKLGAATVRRLVWENMFTFPNTAIFTLLGIALMTGGVAGLCLSLTAYHAQRS